MNDYLVDLDEWIKRFPLDEIPREFWYSGSTRPIDLAIAEQMRRRAARLGPLGPSVPVDVFVFARGEPERRRGTKIGGLPYRPRGLAWPMREDGVSMTFLAQFDFSASKDHVHGLPGDVLLLFTRDEALYTDDDENPPYFHFEWQRADLTDLVPPEEVPPPTWVFPKCYGARYRTVDYKDEHLVAQRIFQLAGRMNSNEASDEQTRRAIARLPGTKIGGLPFCPNPGWQGDVRDRNERMICALADIEPWTNEPFPWLGKDHSIQPDSRILGPEDFLLWRDGCQMNFALDDQQQIRWDVQF
jgi:hypothetical protein